MAGFVGHPDGGLYDIGLCYTPGHLFHNGYPSPYNRAVAEATHHATGESIIWARSAWAGSRRHPLHWGGDSSANRDNLGPQSARGLSLGARGFTFWSQDIGGFLGLDQERVDEQVLGKLVRRGSIGPPAQPGQGSHSRWRSPWCRW